MRNADKQQPLNRRLLRAAVSSWYLGKAKQGSDSGADRSGCFVNHWVGGGNWHC